MANLKEIRTRITSVKSTRQITSAMKMVSASKLRRAQDGIVQLRPYAEKLNTVLRNVGGSVDMEGNPYAEMRHPERILIVVITSNKGLCGGFNANVIKRSILLAEEKYAVQLKNGRVDFFCIGKKGSDFLKAKKFRVIEDANHIFDHLTFDNAVPVINKIIHTFLNKQYDVVEIAFNKFKNAAVQILTTEQFLPIQEKKDNKKEKGFDYDFIFEPSQELILINLIPKSLKTQFYSALLDSYAAEHGARMTAMHTATENATELIKEFTLQYNKARQSSITKEILEIVSGAEALKSK